MGRGVIGCLAGLILVCTSLGLFLVMFLGLFDAGLGLLFCVLTTLSGLPETGTESKSSRQGLITCYCFS